MRLIDADALTDSLDSLCDTVCQYSKAQRSVMCGACPLGGAFDVVENAPTVDAVERKKGKWENTQIDFVFFDKDAVVCSECKDINGIAFTKDFAVKYFHFCPFCGAEMEQC